MRDPFVGERKKLNGIWWGIIHVDKRETGMFVKTKWFDFFGKAILPVPVRYLWFQFGQEIPEHRQNLSLNAPQRRNPLSLFVHEVCFMLTISISYYA